MTSVQRPFEDMREDGLVAVRCSKCGHDGWNTEPLRCGECGTAPPPPAGERFLENADGTLEAVPPTEPVITAPPLPLGV